MTYVVLNGTSADLTVNAANVIAPKGDQVTGVTLTTTELGTLLNTAGVAVVNDTTTEAQKTLLSRLVRFGKYEGHLGGTSGKARR
jgi:hypothetical protein